MTVAAVAMVGAGFFLLRRDFDKAFVVAALGAVAWFLNYRVQMREITAAADEKVVDEEQQGVDEDFEND